MSMNRYIIGPLFNHPIFLPVTLFITHFTVQVKSVKYSEVVGKFCFRTVARIYSTVGKAYPDTNYLTYFRTGVGGRRLLSWLKSQTLPVIPEYFTHFSPTVFCYRTFVVPFSIRLDVTLTYSLAWASGSSNSAIEWSVRCTRKKNSSPVQGSLQGLEVRRGVGSQRVRS